MREWTIARRAEVLKLMFFGRISSSLPDTTMPQPPNTRHVLNIRQIVSVASALCPIYTVLGLNGMVVSRIVRLCAMESVYISTERMGECACWIEGISISFSFLQALILLVVSSRKEIKSFIFARSCRLYMKCFQFSNRLLIDESCAVQYSICTAHK